MKLELISKVKEAKGTYTFSFKPEKKINWLPGQYYYFTLEKLLFEDKRGPTRHFTISSSPTEGENICFTTRIRESSGFKKTLDKLEIGSMVEGEGPSGTFILDESEKDFTHIFIAGGIGITPFRCFIKYNIDKGLNIPMGLIYSNSSPDEITFQKEITKWNSEKPYIRSAMTITKSENINKNWKGLKGRIEAEMVRSLTKSWGYELPKVKFWIVGPPPFNDAMENMLEEMNIDGNMVNSEKFTGY